MGLSSSVAGTVGLAKITWTPQEESGSPSVSILGKVEFRTWPLPSKELAREKTQLGVSRFATVREETMSPSPSHLCSPKERWGQGSEFFPIAKTKEEACAASLSNPWVSVIGLTQGPQESRAEKPINTVKAPEA